ncbi:alginate export family protein [Fulvivirgaceae bacterium BMA12]|uniref:Alginate export family protein n=1 Tax=Agaribacillus aureus TaxID=3051825 RepID=A0ABT8L1I0_9BACT|nr:alginate export family protein [Fulvivirgaceae bacterium BMA12]
MDNTIVKGGIIIMIISSSIISNAQVKLSGDIRSRAEYRHGYKSLADLSQDPAFFISQRTRLTFSYDSEKYKVGIALQDIRTWGNQTQLNISDNLLSIHEAWAEILFKNDLSLKLGRQELVYDDQRILGNVDWAMQGRSHDVALFKYAGKKIKVHLGGAFNQDKEQLDNNIYTVPKNYKTLQFLWMNNKLSDKLSASLLVLNNGLQVSSTDTSGNVKYDTRFSQTLGTRLVHKGEIWSINSSLYLQTGKDGAGKRLSAYNIAADISYKITGKLSAIVGLEYLSGQNQTDTTRAYTNINHSFTPFYGTNHKFNGLMDYFYVGSGHGQVGLQDAFVKIKYKNSKKQWLGADLHIFSSGATVLDNKAFTDNAEIKEMDKYLGFEIDLTGGFKIAKEVDLKMGYSHMLGSETLAILKGVTKTDGNGRTDQISNWAWVMVVIKPTLIDNSP